jgi:hypothetical protein
MLFPLIKFLAQRFGERIMKKEQALTKDIGSKACIVAVNDEMLAVDAELLGEFLEDQGEKCKVVTRGEIIAEGYGAGPRIRILKGADGKS